MIAVVAVIGGSNVTITPPAGWTLILRTNSGTDLAVATYWKRANPDDAEVFTFTLDSSRIAAGGIMAYIDANVSSPVDVSAGQANASSVTATAPAAAATVSAGYIVHAWGAASGVVVAPPDDDEERFDAEAHGYLAGAGAALSDRELKASGATAAVDATLGAAAVNIGQTIVLKPLSDLRDIAPGSASAGNNSVGATTLDLPRPSNLPNDDWTPTEESVRKVVTRYIINGVAYEVDQSKGGRNWQMVPVRDDMAVRLLHAPSQSALVVAEVMRPYPALSADADTTECPLERLKPMAVWQAYELLNKAAASIGQYKAEVAEWQDRAEFSEAKYRPRSVVIV